mgnify:CR=1 FL=1|jgi:hypothetical protein
MKKQKNNPTPENYQEILESEYCRNGIKLNIALIKDQLKQGKRFPFMSTLISLDALNKLNEEFIIEEGKKILFEKKSALTGQYKLLISRMCINAIDLTIAYQNKSK